MVAKRSEPGFLLAAGMCAAGFVIAAAFQKRWHSTEAMAVAAPAGQPQ
jgi:hypothetical protein